MPGRPRKPTHLKLVAGNPGKRPPPKREPKPARWTGAPPASLSSRALECWGRVGPILDKMGVLTVADEAALAECCEAYADILEARASLANPVEVWSVEHERFVTVAEAGALTYVTDGKSGPMLRTRPEVAVISEASRRFMAFLTQFGLTPAARSKVQIADGAGPAEVDSYFG